MPTHLECDGCGAEITENGWRAYPAVLNGTALGGHIIKEGEPHRVGDPVDLCLRCVVADHPRREVTDADNDNVGQLRTEPSE